MWLLENRCSAAETLMLCTASTSHLGNNVCKFEENTDFAYLVRVRYMSWGSNF